MAIQVFISWSGDLSKKLAEVVREWLPATLQFVKPYFTPVDIEKGAKWGTEIAGELEKSDIGIICLTRENLSRPWILFEAGALSKKPKSRVCTILFNVEQTDVTGPLTLFQHTRFLREDFKGLVETINNAGGESKLEKPVFDRVFDMWWPKLEEQASKILAEYRPATQDAGRPVPEMVREILELTRSHVQRQQSDSLQKDKELQSFLSLFATAATGSSPVEKAIRAWLENWVAERSKAVHSSGHGTFSSPPRVPPSGSPEPSPSPSPSPGPEEE